MSERTSRSNALSEEAVLARKHEILTHALRVIARDGLRACTYGTVSQSCGFSVGMLQHYFPSREQLLRACMEHRSEATIQRWLDIESHRSDPLVRLHDLLTISLEEDQSFDQGWLFWVQLLAGSSDEPALRVSLERVLEEWRHVLVRALKQVNETGLLPQPIDEEEVSILLRAMVDGLLVQTLNKHLHGRDIQRLKHHLYRFTAALLHIDAARFAAGMSRAERGML